ncbi:hypothetical protein LBW59_15855 [Ralstonia solanacearum]|uniref:Uncharacterized protein n=1 Tax=Ralstonia solanacearum TaxID=305 RepID=A0AAW5ZQ31_RALSL|nr:hypothetical protein [Ralstonia solanacearum]MDB0543046.1 hypothetical protein [Ralstonia solanacearum]MDB0552728.1 hypothetical protein [Ralstonia solanacearum]MDB0557518.1 hypothetical protein [Ralstonia solanacearum]MDB0572236.1 hypothetical protein [Ralstonia solanacearum]QNT25500.1 hypothetical protein C2I38_25950 [Ralstonia solanacearum]
MAFTLQQLHAIEEAIASGELVIQYDHGKKVEYRNMADLMQAYSTVRQALIDGGQLGGGPNGNRGASTLAAFSRD